MKKQHYWIKILLIIISLSLLTSHIFALEDAIIAIVDDELITLKDLKDYTKSVYTQLKMGGQHTDTQISEIMKSIEENGLDRLIEDRLVLNAANKLGIEARDAAIDEKLNEIKNRYPSEQAFMAALAMDGYSISDLRKQFANQLKTQFYVDMQIKSHITISPQEVTDYYANNPQEFVRPEHVLVDMIFFPINNAPNDALQKITEVHNLLLNGQTLSDAAKAFSITPTPMHIYKGQMKPDIEEQIFKLNDNAFTGPIKSDEGYFIFKLQRRMPAETVSLEEAKNQIFQFLFNKKFKTKMQEWFEKEKANTYLEIKNP